MYLKLIIGDLFWINLISLISAVVLIAYVYIIAQIPKWKLMFFGILLILLASMMMIGFTDLLQDISTFLPRIKVDDLNILIHIQTAVLVLQNLIPLSIAAIGTFFIIKAIDVRLIVK